MTVVLAVPVNARTDLQAQALNDSLETWHRLGCLARARTDAGGHARFGTGQLARDLDLSKTQVSDALTVARRRGWIDQCSTARCVVLPGCALNACEERHR